MEAIGRKRWAIAEGYTPIPARSTGPAPHMTSHETVCILNAGDRDVHVRITIFYVRRRPVGLDDGDRPRMRRPVGSSTVRPQSRRSALDPFPEHPGKEGIMTRYVGLSLDACSGKPDQWAARHARRKQSWQQPGNPT